MKVCNFIGYTRQAYHDGRQRYRKQVADQRLLLEKVRDIRRDNPRMGGLKLHWLIGSQGGFERIKCGRDAFFELLGKNDLLVKKRKRSHPVTTQSFGWYHDIKDHYNKEEFTAPGQA